MNGYKFVFAGKQTDLGRRDRDNEQRGHDQPAIDGKFPATSRSDPGKEPKQIDITLHLKQGDRTVLGIFEIMGDTLKVCYFLATRAAARPSFPRRTASQHRPYRLDPAKK